MIRYEAARRFELLTSAAGARAEALASLSPPRFTLGKTFTQLKYGHTDCKLIQAP